MSVVSQIVDKHYEKLEKMNFYGEFSKQLDFYNWFKAMTGQTNARSRNQDFVSQFIADFTGSMEQQLVSEIQKKRIGEQLAIDVKNAMERSLSEFSS